MFRPFDLFDLSHTEHAAIFQGCEYAWDALKKLKAYIDAATASAKYQNQNPRVTIGERVIIGEGTVIEDGAMIKGPAIIGKNCQIRHNAYIREHVIIGDHCVIGNACEFKHSLLFNHANVPHFSYVGDSILGYMSHLGAGVKISNVKLIPGNVSVLIDGAPFDTASARRAIDAVKGHRRFGFNYDPSNLG